MSRDSEKRGSAYTSGPPNRKRRKPNGDAALALNLPRRNVTYSRFVTLPGCQLED